MEIYKSMLKYHPIGSYHLTSFQEWEYFKLPRQIVGYVITTKTKKYTFVSVELVKKSTNTGPKFNIMTNSPEFSEAQQSSTTFEADITCGIKEYDLATHETTLIENYVIGSIPYMIFPEDEPGEIGGTFLINGNKRVLVTQIRSAYNIPVITKSKPDAKKNKIKNEVVHKPKYKTDTELMERDNDVIIYTLNLRSMSPITHHSCASEIFMTKNKYFFFKNNKFKNKINISHILKALGIINFKDFKWLFKNNDELSWIVYSSSFMVTNQEDALNFISTNIILTQKSMVDYKMNKTEVLKFLTCELFPHIGFKDPTLNIALYIAWLVEQIYNVYTTGVVDDKDMLHLKRFDTSGILISDLFETIIKRWLAELAKECNEKNNFVCCISPESLRKRLTYCFSTGTWGHFQSSYKRMGVSQLLSNMSYLSILSHLDRVSNPISRKKTNQPARALHPSHRGYICPCETPEGQSVGIVLNLAISARITNGVNPIIIIDAMDHLIKPINFLQPINHIIFINGRIVGQVDDKAKFTAEFNLLRRNGRFDGNQNLGMTSISYNNNNIMIWCDEGRIVRCVKNSETEYCEDWREGLIKGIYQWIDPLEFSYGPKYDINREIADCLMFGISAGSIPLCNFQPAPRTVYASSMIKQSISCIGPQHIYTTTLNIARELDVPFISSTIAEIHDINKYPLGNNIIVAITPFGYNQEDAIIFNRSSIERGLFGSDCFKSISFTESSDNENSCKICIPPQKLQDFNNNYCMLDDDGIIKKNSIVKKGDVLIGIVEICKGEEKDVSIVCKENDAIVNDIKIYNVEDSDEFAFYKNVTVELIIELKVNVGDKFASRYGQKGVIGKIINSWEMPFTPDGLVPDVLVNPIGIASRKTIPTLEESLYSIYTCFTGRYFILTQFEDHPRIRELLTSIGVDCDGLSDMINPFDGSKMVQIMIAPQYYVRLPHLAEWKCYARERGINAKATRQPTDGRSRNGGLRMGGMEVDALNGANLVEMVMDRLFLSADRFKIFICIECGCKSINKYICYCGSKNIKVVNCPYTTSLVANIQQAMMCKQIYEVESSNNEEKKLCVTANSSFEYESDDETSSDESLKNTESDQDSDGDFSFDSEDF